MTSTPSSRGSRGTTRWRPGRPRTSGGWTKSAAPLVAKLPALARFGYSTLEDYSSLSSTDQARFRKLAEGVGGIPASDQPGFIESVTEPYGPIEADRAQAAAAEKQPHDTLFRLESVLDGLYAPRQQ